MNINSINTNAVKSATAIAPVNALSSVPFETTGTETTGTETTGTEKTKQKTVVSLKALKTEKTEEEAKSGLSAEEAQKMADVINEQMAELQTNLGFNIREDLNRKVIVEIKNRSTDELIRQIPSEELLTIMKKMEELTGLLFDESV